jgi:hypothetical protein
LLSLANRCYEFGDPARAVASDWGSNLDTSLLNGAAVLASRVRDAQFREEREQLVKDFHTWSNSNTPDIETVIDTLSEMPNSDARALYIDHVSARWASPDSQNRAGIKQLVLTALPNATVLDAILGRLFGLSVSQLSDADLATAIRTCAANLLTELREK